MRDWSEALVLEFNEKVVQAAAFSFDRQDDLRRHVQVDAYVFLFVLTPHIFHSFSLAPILIRLYSSADCYLTNIVESC